MCPENLRIRNINAYFANDECAIPGFILHIGQLLFKPIARYNYINSEILLKDYLKFFYYESFYFAERYSRPLLISHGLQCLPHFYWSRLSSKICWDENKTKRRIFIWSVGRALLARGAIWTKTHARHKMSR